MFHNIIVKSSHKLGRMLCGEIQSCYNDIKFDNFFLLILYEVVHFFTPDFNSI